MEMDTKNNSRLLTGSSTRCTKCHKVLTAGVEYRSTIWHRDCLTCRNCCSKLAGTKFTTFNNEPYCFICYGKLHAYKCQACHGAFYEFGDEFFIYMEGIRWHLDCFRCIVCDTALLGETSLNTPDGVLCTRCGQA